MRVALTVVAPAMRRTADVLLEADPATPMADIAAELASFIGGDAMERPSVPLYVSRRQIPPQLSLAQARVRDGAVVSLGNPDGCVSPEQAGLVEVRVTSGPTAGSVYRLGAGHWDMGSGHAAGVRIGDPSVPPVALRISVNGRGGCQIAPREGAGATVDREPLTAPARGIPARSLPSATRCSAWLPTSRRMPRSARHLTVPGSTSIARRGCCGGDVAGTGRAGDHLAAAAGRARRGGPG